MLVKQQSEAIRRKGGLVGRILGNDRDLIPFNAGFLLTILLTAVTAVMAFYKHEFLNTFIPLVTLSLGYTFGSKMQK